jgi:hypothetical protein
MKHAMGGPMLREAVLRIKEACLAPIWDRIMQTIEEGHKKNGTEYNLSTS